MRLRDWHPAFAAGVVPVLQSHNKIPLSISFLSIYFLDNFAYPDSLNARIHDIMLVIYKCSYHSMKESEHPHISAVISERAELIKSIGVAERVSWGLRLVMNGTIDNQLVRLLFPRKRGLTKDIVLTDLGGGASFCDPAPMAKLLATFPTGKAVQQDTYPKGGVWVNGYVMEERDEGYTDVRVYGFDDALSQAKFEVLLSPYIEYLPGIRREIKQEFGTEWQRMPTDIRAHEKKLTPAWSEAPYELANSIMQNSLQGPGSYVSQQNRLSGRSNMITHTVTSIGAVHVDGLDKFVDMGYVQPVFEPTEPILAPLPAISLTLLEEMKGKLPKVIPNEDIESPFLFYGKIPIKVGMNVFEY